MTTSLESRAEMLTDWLEWAVPLRMAELAGRPAGELAGLARAQVDTLTAHGDDLQFGGRHARGALAALVTGLAAAALTAEGGATWRGLHWCATAHDHCPAGPTRLLNGDL